MSTTRSCHCGAVRFDADLDLSAGTFKCNCEMCTKTRMWGVIAKPDAFRLLAGEADLKDYHPDNIHHVFCKHCGVRSFAWGDNSAISAKFYAVRVSCIAGMDIDELVNALYYDGGHDNYESPPTETRHL